MYSSIRKGLIGEYLVAINLLKKGYDVYSPIIDDNGIDYIVVNKNKIVKLQVKTYEGIQKYETSIEVDLRKCYKADVIAVPIYNKNCVCYFPYIKNRRSFNIAFKDSLSGQKKGRNYYTDYLDIPWADD